MVPPSEYLFLPLIMLACLLLQPFVIPPQIKARKTKRNLSNRSGDERHPWMVGLRSSAPHSWPPHIQLGHGVIVLYVRANPKRNAWFKPGSSAVRQEDQFSPPTHPFAWHHCRKGSISARHGQGDSSVCTAVHGPREVMLQQRWALLFSLQHTGRQELWDACETAHACCVPHFHLTVKFLLAFETLL